MHASNPVQGFVCVHQSSSIFQFVLETRAGFMCGQLSIFIHVLSFWSSIPPRIWT